MATNKTNAVAAIVVMMFIAALPDLASAQYILINGTAVKVVFETDWNGELIGQTVEPGDRYQNNGAGAFTQPFKAHFQDTNDQATRSFWVTAGTHTGLGLYIAEVGMDHYRVAFDAGESRIPTTQVAWLCTIFGGGLGLGFVWRLLWKTVERLTSAE